MRASLRLLPVLTLAALLGCPNSGEDRLLTVSATGVVKGFVVFDVNGSRTVDQGDDSLAGIRVRLVTTGARDSIAAAVSLVSGVYRMGTVPAGTYLVVVDTAPFGDTVIVAKLDSSQVTVPPGDSVAVNVLISYPHVSVRAARTTVPLGRKVFVEGVALNSLNTFSDATLHMQDTSGAIRMTRVRPFGGFQYDTLRLKGTTRTHSDGQPILDDVTVTLANATLRRAPDTVTTAQAATAQAGTRDADQVAVRNATISDTATVGQDFLLTVNDGSGALGVLLDAQAFSILPLGLVPGNKFHIGGLLVMSGAVWRLKPRSSLDLVKQ